MNKPRLIDANELIEVVKNIQNHMKEVNEKPVPVDAREIFSLFVEMIDCQPTAYDIDKVVEQLEALRKPIPNDYGEDIGGYLDFDKTIKIVKGGGKHDD